MATLSPELLARLDRYFIDTAIGCPYGLGYTAVYHQAEFSSLSPALLDHFLEGGYRRNGNILYSMACRECQACVPIRLALQDFRPKRGMRRVLAKNRDLEVVIAEPAVDGAKLALLDRFLASRYPGKGNGALDYYSGFFLNSLGLSVEISFHLEGRLLGSSLVDCSEDALSAVYFYFDPDYGSRSLGTFNILFLADLARSLGLSYLYLGYFIAEVPAMAYKSRFRPHELLLGDSWCRVG